MSPVVTAYLQVNVPNTPPYLVAASSFRNHNTHIKTHVHKSCESTIHLYNHKQIIAGISVLQELPSNVALLLC
jgi:hypothetical protein